jgi:hypothetical protein
MHADFYDLPDDTRYNTSANSLNKIKILEEEVSIDDCEQSLQSISLILSSEGTDTQCINQKAHLMSEQNQLSPDCVAGLEEGGRHLRRCDYQIEHKPSHSGGVFERDMRPM